MKSIEGKFLNMPSQQIRIESFLQTYVVCLMMHNARISKQHRRVQRLRNRSSSLRAGNHNSKIRHTRHTCKYALSLALQPSYLIERDWLQDHPRRTFCCHFSHHLLRQRKHFANLSLVLTRLNECWSNCFLPIRKAICLLRERERERERKRKREMVSQKPWLLVPQPRERERERERDNTLS